MSVIPSIDGKRVYSQLSGFKQKHPNLKDMQWDVVVIGSGMAGMSAAAALSKYKRKVLVLEKHYLPGGYTHMFSRKGADWDVGTHAVGDMHEGGKSRKQLDWLTGGKLKMSSIGEMYDEFYYPDNFKISFSSSLSKYREILYRKFPDEKKVIDNYIKYCLKAAKQAIPYFAFKTLPKTPGVALDKIWRTLTRDWWSKTTDEVLNELGASFRLRNVLTGQWGYYGSNPQNSSFGVQALIFNHFSHGAYYPENGSKQFASFLLSEVIRSGGECVCKAPVVRLIIRNKRCCGVVLEDGTEIFGKKVISAIASKNTVKDLMPGKYQKSKWGKSILSLQQSPGYLCLNLIFQGDISQHGASSRNIWIMNEWGEGRDSLWDFTNSKTDPGTLFISFPSLKDPLYSPGEKQVHTGEVIVFVDWEQFEKWKDTRFNERPRDYEDLKKQIENSLLQLMEKHFPGLMKLKTYHELSTPLTASHFVSAFDGSTYGLASTPERYNNPNLRVRTPVKNLYMSGVDIVTSGISGARSSGLLAAATIDPRIFRILRK
ncbi:Carotenoid cis-trans isomerase [Chitinispirillum alkaliphilum]|nr:Carotenoid cis-trans isomerase [Chitinispirillum alkaliphilum]